ncbi:MAG: serine/threonine-protein kinase, partial [Nannocystaceae bacterium]
MSSTPSDSASAGDSAITRVAGGDTTLLPGSARGGLSVVAKRLFREPLDPVRLSRYILLEPLGQGAFGAVYAAYDPELNRKVAIKLLVPRVDDEGTEGRERLLREAQAMAHFSHRNVVAVHDVGTYSLDSSLRNEVSEVVRDGVFIVMELVDGQRLDDWARGRQTNWRQIVERAIEAAEGLAAAHEAGLVHRDFKPANVLVDQGNHPKILDFGLARLHSGASGSGPDSRRSMLESVHDSVELDDKLAADLTRTGTVVGTPRYMAPEQHRGDEFDALADQYSFCVTLYELLYSKPPFRAQRLDDLIRATLEISS